MKETQLVRQILDYCQYNHLMFWRNNSGAIRTEKGGLVKMAPAGSPDIIGCFRGHFVGAECKVGKNKQTDMQIDFGRRLVAAGGYYHVIYSLDEFVDLINKLHKIFTI